MTFVYQATSWFEIAEITDKTSARISQIFNNTWLSHHPRPQKNIFDNVNEFKKDFLIGKQSGIENRKMLTKTITNKIA